MLMPDTKSRLRQVQTNVADILEESLIITVTFLEIY